MKVVYKLKKKTSKIFFNHDKYYSKNGKRKKKLRKKSYNNQIIFTIVIVLLIILNFRLWKSYAKNYQIENFTITERFDKTKNLYTFEIQKEEFTWYFMIEHKYVRKKKLITELKYHENESTKCIIPKSAKLTTYPQCIKDNEYIDYHLISEDLKQEIGDSYYHQDSKIDTDNYEKITIKNLDENTYYIWNYKGFYKINKEKKENINLFSKDIYDISQVTYVKDLLVIPDYNASYYFNKFYLISMKKGNVITWEFKDNISFDGYYLGSDNNSLFYVDKKNKIEWEILPKRKKMRKVGTEKKEGKILKKEKWEPISLTKLISQTYQFEKLEHYHYEIDNGLYITYLENNIRKKISEKNVKEIVATIKNKVYYLVGDTLYYYTEETGEVEIMNYFEWNFNYQNMIFIKEK